MYMYGYVSVGRGAALDRAPGEADGRTDIETQQTERTFIESLRCRCAIISIAG